MLLFVAAACSRPPDATTSTSTSTTTATATSTATATATATAIATSPLIAARPYGSFVPSSAASPAPLVLVLHGYGGTGRWQTEYFGLLALAETRGFLLAFPDGTPDRRDLRFWNATDACCDFDHRAPDDVAYLTAVLDDMSTRHAVDPKRVYVIGLSNGGFMAHRLACERAERVAAIVSMAGAQWRDEARCAPAMPVSVVEAHESYDNIVSYEGGTVFDRKNIPAFPSAHKTVATWAKKNGCTGALAPAGGAKLDLNALVAGPDTAIARYAGCPASGAVELWTIQGGAHVPRLERAFADAVWEFFASHARP